MAFGSLVQKADTLIRDWMKINDLREGTRLPSERALARQLELPHYSVNRAMAHLISEGVVIREGYKLFCGSSKMTDGPFSCHLLINYNSTSLRSFRKVARELGISLIVHRWEALDDAVSRLHELDSSTTPGIIFEPPFGHGNYSWENTAMRLWNHSVPIICTGTAGNGLPSILADHPRALRLIFEHLQELGHTELAFVSVPRSTPTVTEIMDAWKLLCEQFHFSRSVQRIIKMSSSLVREDIADIINRLTGDWNGVTALVVYTEIPFNVAHLIDGLAKRKKIIPKDLSLIFLRDQGNLCTMTPPISAANSDSSVIHEMAFRMVQRLARRGDTVGLAHAANSIRVLPELILRGSTALSPSCMPRQRKSLSASVTASRELSPADVEQSLRTALERPYPLAARAEKSRFEQLDLRKHVNRPLNFRRGWLGDLPLRNFDPGERVIHGVPFHVNGGHSRSDCGAIVFHSNINTRGNAKVLPTRLRLAVGSKAKAIYILHGCGYARFLKSFAAYSFYSGKKRVDKVPLVSLGQPPANHDANAHTPDFPTANIQDWWPDVPQRNFSQARMAPINEGDGTKTISRYVYLYTLEWINPKPDKLIDTMEIEVAPGQSTTLGVLAITVLNS